ncbi:MAG TPA: SDR family oxidoreductase [Chloroflexia bacterium]|nr:SDR family oxidoreductase [Chloroflexia bacterium]
MSQEQNKKDYLQPPQQQGQPGIESKMHPRPKADDPAYRGSGKLQDKVALITGGDSGIGRSVAYFFAKEGADISIVYLNEDSDARETKEYVEKLGRRCITISGDVGDEAFCRQAVEQTVQQLGKLDILVNNAGEQHWQKSIEDISAEQLERTFRTNVYSCFFMTKAALKYLKEGSAIISTTSRQAYVGSTNIIDYAATKGAIVSFTRALSQALVEKGIRVNAVAPGPIWTPLDPANLPPEKVAMHGTDVPMKRAGQPEEVAPSFVFLASDDASYMTGQVLHPNGGLMVGS